MKIRHDFVSNSSSSSFVISNEQRCDVLHMSQRFLELFKFVDSSTSEYAGSITIRISCKNKDFVALWKYIAKVNIDHDLGLSMEDKCPYCDFYEDYRTRKPVKKDPEEVSWDRIDGNFELLKYFAYDPSIAQKIVDIEFSTIDDYDMMQIDLLKKLFAFFEVINCNPDASNSEQILFDDESRSSQFSRVIHDTIVRNGHTVI